MRTTVTKPALILIAWLLALAAIAMLNSEHEPQNGGLPVVKSAAADRRPVTRRLNSVCTIGEHKGGVHIA